MTDAPPPGWMPIFRSSPFLDLAGPIYFLEEEKLSRLGFRVEQKHCNSRGSLHGGVVSTVADVALGYTMAYSVDPPISLTTVSLTVDFTGRAVIGDWVEAHVDIQKLGGRTGFANAFFFVGEERIARASGVFVRNRPPEGKA